MPPKKNLTPEKRNLTETDNPGETSNLTKQQRLASEQIVSLNESATLESSWRKFTEKYHGFVSRDNAGEGASDSTKMQSEHAKSILHELEQFSTTDQHHLMTLLSLNPKTLKRFIITNEYVHIKPQLERIKDFHDYIGKYSEGKEQFDRQTIQNSIDAWREFEKDVNNFLWNDVKNNNFLHKRFVYNFLRCENIKDNLNEE